MDVLWKENNIFYNILCVLITENEKLFDRSDARLYWKTVYHMFLILHHGYVANFGASLKLGIDHAEIRKLKKFRVAYLTGWNFSFQTVFLGLALLHDLLRWLDKHDSKLGKKIKYFRDVIFNGLVFPFTCFVTGMFWCVYLIDRELVFPQVYDQIVPWWLNHCVHTNIFIVITIETLLTRRRQPTDVKVERCMWVFVSVFYAVVYYSVYFFGGCWLYGVFGVMTWWQVCIYQACIWGSTWVFYNFNFFVNKMIHKEGDATPKTSINGDLESRETTFQNAKVDGVVETGSSKIRKDVELSTKDSGKANAAYLNDNNDTETEKQWKAGVSKNDGSLNQSLDKSTGTNFKRNQFEKASL
ncbi:androgen-dependent TFPI-regulating protein-like isoform X1 [Cydia amplana]|uniref:androgen-dependent TFPI-regulating protein-like isoform X1 n=1 Tax=Cydia amplana TaxID=1869771 RepID=UPI002FE5DD59